MKINDKTHTCFEERGNDLFAKMNVISGKAAILSQSINDFPKGFGSLSHNFNTQKIKMKKKKKRELKEQRHISSGNYICVMM